MRVRVHIDQEGYYIDQVFEGRTEDEVLGSVKRRVARDLPFALRIAVSSIGNVAFAQEVVRRYNDRMNTTYPSPRSSAEFLKLAEEIGMAEVVQP
ncbi:MAG TPA: hypothetical protein VGS41_04310 [Chthonomonadales bacterium]|nr:hypothetical protein [Chthonomonadales bacterium]